MQEPSLSALLSPELAGALAKKGFTELTPVQKAVLDPELAGRDLRITSQTGSGKTVAVGFAIQGAIDEFVTRGEGPKPPCALVVTPTRELAKQFEEELSWLFAPLGAKVASVAGGAFYRDERRALSASPAVIVGTPGRLVDHLTRGGIDATEVSVVVLDEADRLLDMGFKEELDQILEKTPEGGRRILMSATFPRDVKRLADRVQKDAVHVEGTRLGEANVDIEHVIVLVDAYERASATVNLLLAEPEMQTLIFCRTRADVANLAKELTTAGFRVAALSGELEQNARNRALAAFKRGELDALVATDVAARGIDVVDIARVIQVEPPNDADTYTHRSGRTGRAGRKGLSMVLVPPGGLPRTSYLLQRARVEFHVAAAPTAEDVKRKNEVRLFAELIAEDPDGFAGIDERVWALAKRLVAEGNPTRVIARLLSRKKSVALAEPRVVRRIEPHQGGPAVKSRRERLHRETVTPGKGEFFGGPPMAAAALRPSAVPRFEDADGRERTAESGRRTADSGRRAADGGRRTTDGGQRAEGRGQRDGKGQREWATYRVSWGALHGADPRRLLAMACRRGEIEGRDIGAIRVERNYSTIEVAREVAADFEARTKEPDPRDPRVKISRDWGDMRGQRPEARGERRDARGEGREARGDDGTSPARPERGPHQAREDALAVPPPRASRPRVAKVEIEEGAVLVPKPRASKPRMIATPGEKAPAPPVRTARREEDRRPPAPSRPRPEKDRYNKVPRYKKKPKR